MSNEKGPQPSPRPAPREDELDQIDEEDEEEEIDEEEYDDEEEEDEDEPDDEEEEEEEEDEEDEPEPLRPPIPGRKKRGRPKNPNPMNKEDLKTLILERFEQGWTSYDIHEWLKQENILDEETGEYLTIHQIGGWKSQVTSLRRQGYITGGGAPPIDAQINPLPAGYQAPATAPVQPATPPPPPINVPRPRTKLETFYEMLEKAQATRNEALAQIAVDGIYKEMERGERSGSADERVWTLLTAMLTENKGKSKLSELKELTGLVKDLMPAQPEGESEAVGMARVMADTVEKVSRDAKDTILEVTGTKSDADKMGKCPNCAKIIPRDSLFCSYCGLSFQKVEDEEKGEEEEEESEEEQKARAREEELRKKRAELAKRAVKTPPSKPETPTPQPQAPPAQPRPKPTPQVQPVGATPTAGDTGPIITPEERASVLRNLKRLANFITNKDDPVLKTQALYKVGDEEDKKNTLFLAIIGRDLLLKSARRLIQEHPELTDFVQYVELCDSVDGHAWIDRSFEEIKNLSRLGGITLKREEAAEMLAKMEAKMGFPIE